jgi:hypothetical protein
LREFQVRVHRRDAEDTEAAQRPDSRTLRNLSDLCGEVASDRLLLAKPPRTPSLLVASFAKYNLAV